MKRDLDSIKAILASTPVSQWRGQLTRRVEFLALTRYNPPNWLHTSGRPNRYNPKGVPCVYFAGNAEIARIEYDAIWQRAQASKQPAAEFTAEVNLLRVLDLLSPAVLTALSLHPKDLTVAWRFATSPTITQVLGRAVAESDTFSAIRYPSIAGAQNGADGCNFVIYPRCVRHPEYVRILGPSKEPLQTWPL